MRYPRESIEKLKELRRRGHTISEMMKSLSMPKTTVWHHAHRVKVLPKYVDEWRAKQGGSINRFNQEYERARNEAGRTIRSLNRIEKMLIAVSLYWAEGSKRDFSLSNTDPNLIRVFIDCLREFGVDRRKLSINIRIYEDLNIENVCRYWSKVTGLPRREIKYANILHGKKKGKLPYGMCRVRVKKPAYLLKFFNALRESIIKLAPL